MRVGEEPAIVAAAYINSYGKPEATKMYDIDSTIVSVDRQVSANGGTLGAIGKLKIDSPAETYAFDVQTNDAMENMAWLVNGNMLYSVDLETGAATGVGMIEGLDGDIRDITALPVM